jgi:thiol-disulfide isomerase/thioredoxin
MNRSTIIALTALGALAILALIVLSRGPSISLTNPNNPRVLVAPTNLGAASSLPVYDVTLPEFSGITHWWNTSDGKPLTPDALKGKVVLVDFWTYSCINCIRTYPFLRSMHEKYGSKGLVIVGVHTPEFEFEKNPENVEREIKKNDLKYPIALDPDYVTWNLFGNHYWPAGYLFDKQGRLRRAHFGEGEYTESEAAIRSLLEEQGVKLDDMAKTEMETPDFAKIKTPETYFGLSRGEAFMGPVGPRDVDVTLQTSEILDANAWTAAGVWRFTDQYVQAISKDAVFRFRVQATKLHLVLESADGGDKRIEIFVDGVKTGEMTVNASTLYDIATFADASEHVIEIRVIDPGVRFFAATFS